MQTPQLAVSSDSRAKPFRPLISAIARQARDDRSFQSSICDFLDRRKQRRECILRHKTGFDLYVEVATSQLPDGCFICILHDNTKWRVAEAELRDSQQRIALAIEATAIGIWEWNVHTNSVTWDAALFRIGIPQTADRRVSYETWARPVHQTTKSNKSNSCENMRAKAPSTAESSASGTPIWRNALHRSGRNHPPQQRRRE